MKKEKKNEKFPIFIEKLELGRVKNNFKNSFFATKIIEWPIIVRLSNGMKFDRSLQFLLNDLWDFAKAPKKDVKKFVWKYFKHFYEKLWFTVDEINEALEEANEHAQYYKDKFYYKKDKETYQL